MMNHSTRYKLALLVTGLALVPFWASAQLTLPNPLGTIDSFGGLLGHIARYILTVVGAVATLMFLIAGIVFLVSAGNPNSIQRARKIALYAAIGLAISLLGSGLITFIQYLIGA